MPISLATNSTCFPRCQVIAQTSEELLASAYSQFQSPLFSFIPREVRDEIYAYALALDHHIHPGMSRRLFITGCHSYTFHLLDCPTTCDKLDTPLTNHHAALLKSCRRMYDETRRFLYNGNTFIFGTSCYCDLSKEIMVFATNLSLHSGQPCSPISIGTLVLVLGDDQNPAEAYVNINAVSWALHRVPMLRVQHLKLMFLRYNFKFAEEAKSLHIVLESLQAVKTCEIIGLTPKPASPDYWYDHRDVKGKLIQAALAKPTCGENVVGNSCSTVFTPCPLWEIGANESDHLMAWQEARELGLI